MVLVQVVRVVFAPLPGQVVGVASGSVFGVASGTLYSRGRVLAYFEDGSRP